MFPEEVKTTKQEDYIHTCNGRHFVKKKSHTSGEILHTVLPPFYHRDWVFLGLTNTVGGLVGGGGVVVL